MAYQEILRTMPYTPAGRSVDRFVGLIKLWRARSRSRRCLRRVEDRILDDIGVTRIDADKEARKYFWQA